MMVKLKTHVPRHVDKQVGKVLAKVVLELLVWLGVDRQYRKQKLR